VSSGSWQQVHVVPSRPERIRTSISNPFLRTSRRPPSSRDVRDSRRVTPLALNAMRDSLLLHCLWPDYDTVHWILLEFLVHRVFKD
jgi:hypothetical protein